MALTFLRFDVAGVEHYARGFDLMATEAKDLRDPLTDIAHDLRQRIGRQFSTQGAAEGTPWAPLSAAYAAWKEQHFPGRPLLVQTARMRGEMLNPAAFEVTEQRMVYEVDERKAYWHQTGAGHNPARPMVVLSAAARRDWDHLWVQWIHSLRNRTIGT